MSVSKEGMYITSHIVQVAYILQKKTLGTIPNCMKIYHLFGHKIIHRERITIHIKEMVKAEKYYKYTKYSFTLYNIVNILQLYGT